MKTWLCVLLSLTTGGIDSSELTESVVSLSDTSHFLPWFISLWGCSTVFCSDGPKPQQWLLVQVAVPGETQHSTNNDAQDSLGPMVSSSPPRCCYSRWAIKKNWLFTVCVLIAALHRNTSQTTMWSDALACPRTAARTCWFSCFILSFTSVFAALKPWMVVGFLVTVWQTHLWRGGFKRSHASNTEPSTQSFHWLSSWMWIDPRLSYLVKRS